MKIERIFSPFVLLILLFSLGALTAQAQTGSNVGSISGLIADEQGARIGSVSIKAKNLSTNQEREVTSAEDGSFLVPQLSPGDYELAVSAEGFKSQTIRVELQLGTTVKVDFALKIGTPGEVVVVKADSNSVNPEKTENSTNIDRGFIENLPINQRNFLDFSLTTPRVVIDRRPNAGSTNSSGFSINAQSGRENNLTIDGFDNNDAYAGNVRQTFSQDAVQEFQVVSDNFSAEFGRSTSGTINIVTKGGANELHSSLFFFDRNDSISAREPFASTKPEFKQYQFGATLGGPIKKDKSFFFLSFERLSVKQNNIVTIDDQTIQSVRNVGYTVSSGAQPAAQDTSTFLSRADFQINPNDRLTLRYGYAGTYNGSFDAFGALAAASSGSINILTDNSIAATNTYIIPGLNLINETRFIYNRLNQQVLSNDANENFSNTQIIEPTGTASIGRADGLPATRKENLYEIVDNLSLIRSRQQFKFGIDYTYRSIPSDAQQPILNNGFALFVPFDFASSFGNPNIPFLAPINNLDPSTRTPAQIGFLQALGPMLAQVVPGFPPLDLSKLSLPAIFLQGFGKTNVDPGVTLNQFSGYAQDEIKVRPNLLVKLGARYDINRVRFEPDNNGNVAPRIGIAYNPMKNLLIRAGYGIFFGTPISAIAFPGQLTGSGQIKAVFLPFPFSVLAYNQPDHRFPEQDTVPASLAGLPPGLSFAFQFDHNLRNSYSHQATFSVEYHLNDKLAVSASYVYVRGLKILSERDVNPVDRPVPNNPLLSAIIGREDPTRGIVSEFSNFADSYYNGGTFSVSYRVSDRFDILAHYTVSKAIDDVTDIRTDIGDTPQDIHRPDLERGLSLLDVRNRFVLTGVWNLNYTKNPFLRGFQLSTITTVESGKPYNLLAGADLNMDGVIPPGDRPIVNGVPLGRDAGITPGFADVDLRLTRTINIKEKIKLEGIAEAFNLFNRVNIKDIDRNFPPGPNGFNLPPLQNGRYIVTPDRFRGAFPPRRIQLGFRLVF
jgi:hypothetical protein